MGRKINKNIDTICYLCGGPLKGDKNTENDDHVPPKQLLAKSLRKKHQINLIRLRTHTSCNSSYSLDEEYFKHCLVPFAKGTVAGNAIYEKTVDEYNGGRNVPLVNQILHSAKKNINGVKLPDNIIALDYNKTRINRVIKKIIKGLYFYEMRNYLDFPDEINFEITLPNRLIPEDFHYLMTNLPIESKGEHEGVFSYRNWIVDDNHFWALLIWDRILITGAFKAKSYVNQLK